MNQEIKQRWITALRSGQYKHGIGNLKINDCFCVLGILCDIHAQETGNTWEKEDGFARELYLGKYGELPEEVVEWAGLDGVSPKVGAYDLTEINDLFRTSDGKLFEHLASVIEDYL